MKTIYNNNNNAKIQYTRHNKNVYNKNEFDNNNNEQFVQ